MKNHEIPSAEERLPITSPDAMEQAIRDIEQQEQLYSIALFDILGFSNLVQNNGTQIVLDLYNKLLDIIHKMESNYSGNGTLAGSVVPVPVSQDWKNNQLIADANGYIHVCHFSDTFLIYTHYLFKRPSWWLRDSFYEPYPLLIGEKNTEFCSLFFQEHPIYLSFLQVCIEFFCEAVKAGIPLRGCISTGMATMNKHQSIFFGKPLVEAARGEPAQNAIGVAFGRSFNNYHPVYNRYFIPYLGNIKDNDKKSEFLSPMMLDWPQFWRNHHEYKDISIAECIEKMNTNPACSGYYDNAIKFATFSEKHQNWPEQIDRTDMTDIIDYYERVKAWYNSVLTD